MKLAVIGLGKLGAPLAAVFASKGFNVSAWDADPEAIERFWTRPPPEPGLQEMIYANRARLRTGDPESCVSHAEAVFIIVPTPSQEDGTFTNAYVLEAIARIRLALGPDTVVNIVSTVMPGSCDGPIREALPPGQPLTYSPEFIALGSVIADMLEPDYILIGESSKRAGDVISNILRRATDNNPPVHRMSLASAELAKLMTNAYVCMKIGFGNMLANVCDHLAGASARDVAKAIGADHRIGDSCLAPGLGYGGPCLPRDTRALSTVINDTVSDAAILHAVDRGNRERIARVMDKVLVLSAAGEPVAILGQSYKPGTPVIEASQGVELGQWLHNAGRRVRSYDPMAICSCSSMETAVKDVACVVIATPWPEFRDVKRHTQAPVIDPWGLLEG